MAELGPYRSPDHPIDWPALIAEDPGLTWDQGMLEANMGASGVAAAYRPFGRSRPRSVHGRMPVVQSSMVGSRSNHRHVVRNRRPRGEPSGRRRPGEQRTTAGPAAGRRGMLVLDARRLRSPNKTRTGQLTSGRFSRSRVAHRPMGHWPRSCWISVSSAFTASYSA